MTYRVIIEPTAERGIRTAVRWIAGNASEKTAARWYNGLLRKINTLKTHPGRCPLAAENDEFPQEIRELLHGRRNHKYRIIFTVHEDAVVILYVHHGARDELDP
jgi:plasmid stabilization system protein ParE